VLVKDSAAETEFEVPLRLVAPGDQIGAGREAGEEAVDEELDALVGWSASSRS